MTTVIAIRAGNGAGKSWCARKIMDATEKDFKKKAKLSNGVLINVYSTYVVIGSYDRPTGGADTISKPQTVFDAVVEAAQYSNVFFEGALVGTCWEPIVLLRERLEEIGAEYIPICLDTSYEQCIDNINQRRALKGDGPLEKLSNIEISYKKHLSSAKKMHEAGWNPHWVSCDEAVKIALEKLK